MYSKIVKKKKATFRIFSIILFLVISLEIIILSQNPNRKSVGTSSNSLEELKAIKAQNINVYDGLRNSIKTTLQKRNIDGAIKLTEAALAQQDISLDECHNLLHLIGHEAYQYLNADFSKLATFDSVICISSFQHGVEAQIIYSSKNPTEELKQYCSALRQRYPGISCYHGAGHGYMQIFKDINKALSGCDLLEGGPDKELWNCYRGIFSEYGNMTLGVDSDTGQPLPDGPTVSIDKDSPLLFCNQFLEKYQESCYSQVTKVLVSGDLTKSLNSCLNSEYSMRAKEICISIISGVISRSILSNKENFEVPEIVHSLPLNLRRAYILGVKETFIGLKTSRINRNWDHFCNLFKHNDDKSHCLSVYQ